MMMMIIVMRMMMMRMMMMMATTMMMTMITIITLFKCRYQLMKDVSLSLDQAERGVLVMRVGPLPRLTKIPQLCRRYSPPPTNHPYNQHTTPRLLSAGYHRTCWSDQKHAHHQTPLSLISTPGLLRQRWTRSL